MLYMLLIFMQKTGNAFGIKKEDATMLKKILALTLALVLALAMFATVFAEAKKDSGAKAPVQYRYKWVDMGLSPLIGTFQVEDGQHHSYNEHLRTLDHTQYGTSSDPYIVIYYGYGLFNVWWQLTIDEEIVKPGTPADY